MFRDSAIYKFTIDIDIDIDCTTDCTGSAVKLQRSNNHATRECPIPSTRRTDECLVSSVTFPFIRIRFREPFTESVSALPFRSAVANATLYRTGTEKNSILFERMAGIGKLTETENVIFLRSRRNSYGILTDKLNSDTHRLERQYDPFVKQEQWERWRAKRKLVSGSKHPGRFDRVPEGSPLE